MIAQGNVRMKKYNSYLSATFALYLLGLACFVGYNYLDNKEKAIARIDTKLIEAASSVPLLVGNKYFSELSNTPPGDDVEKEMVRKLTEFSKINKIKYVYLMRSKNDKIVFALSGATDEEIEKGTYSKYDDAYNDASDVLKQVFVTKKVSFEEYTDKWGSFRSVLIPWRSPSGEFFIIGADFPISELNDIYLKDLLTSIFTGLYFLLLAVPFVLCVMKSSKEAKLTLEAEVKRQTIDIEQLNQNLAQRVTEAENEAQKALVACREAEDYRLQAEQAKVQGMLEASARIKEVVAGINAASEALSVQVEQSSEGADRQSSQVSETAAAMEEMNSTVLEIARNSAESAKSADDARQKAQAGNEIVVSVIKSIEDIQNIALALKENMDALGKQAAGIGQIANVISDIADQTNLLALNAAIEAARAGDAGRGFAVVADEVRKLAEKTQVATKEVEHSIQAIQSGAKTNIENVEQAVRTISAANSQASNSGQALREIVDLIGTASDRVQAIATASEQQSATSEEISRSIENVAAISSETADAMRQSAMAVSELAQQAAILRQLVVDMQSDG